MKTVTLATDGSCFPNPGPGGWGWVLVYGKHEREGSGNYPSTTNNRMEVVAVIMGLTALKYSCVVNLLTDSQYVERGIATYMHRWKSEGWPEDRPNMDLWRRLDKLLKVHDVTPQWVRGHRGHPLNERADKLAGLARKELDA